MMNFKIDADFKPTVKWLEGIKKGLGDARPLLVIMRPQISKYVNMEFTDRNPNKWQKLSDKWLARKRKLGKPSTIGIFNGNLKDGATTGADVSISQKEMLWKLNQSGVVSDKGYPYAWPFHKGRKDGKQPARTLFKYTVIRLNTVVKGLTLKWVASEIEKAK